MPVKIVDEQQIREVVKGLDLVAPIEAGFVAYSSGRAVIPPVGELLFREPPGEVHIKYGYISDDPYFVVKVASGFYENAGLDLPSGDGLMLLFSQRTGQLLSVLLDRGFLTDLRTGLAGAVAAKFLAPRPIHCVGMVGTGTQARFQLRCLAGVCDCRRVMVWGRHPERTSRYREEMEKEDFSIEVTTSLDELASSCTLIVTATPATSPLLQAAQIQPGTHITAVGADTPQKQELHPDILNRADLVVADSIAQCRERGEIAHALRRGKVLEKQLVELGDVISGKVAGRTTQRQITVADLTGVAVQDIQIARAVFEAVQKSR